MVINCDSFQCFESMRCTGTCRNSLSPRRGIYDEQGIKIPEAIFSVECFWVMSNLFWCFWEHTIGLICSDRCQTSQINCFLSSSVARNASFGCLASQSSNDPSMMEVRPPKFLHGFGRAQSSPWPSPNAGSSAEGARPQPFSEAATQNDVARGSTS